MRQHTYKLIQEEVFSRSGTLFYCTAEFQSHNPGDEHGTIVIASRESKVDAFKRCVLRAEGERKRRVKLSLPRIKCHGNERFSYTYDSTHNSYAVDFTALGKTVEEPWWAFQTLLFEMHDQYTEETINAHISRYRTTPPMKVVPPEVPKKWSFWDWFR